LAFTTRLNKNISERLNKYDQSEKSMTSERISEKPIRKPLTDAQEKTMRVMANIKESNKYERAKEILGYKSLSSINDHIRLAKSKGYSLEEFKENDD